MINFSNYAPQNVSDKGKTQAEHSSVVEQHFNKKTLVRVFPNSANAELLLKAYIRRNF